MPDAISRMSSTSFIMTFELSPTARVEVTITGRGLQYDRATGSILSGEIDDISLLSKVLVNRSWRETDVRSVMGIDTPAETLADTFGTKFWNDAKLVVDVFDKFQTLHDGISTGYFAKTRNEVRATEESDTIRAYKYADTIKALGGDDDVYGGNGHDKLYGGRGDDLLDGGRDNDLLIDRDGHNSLYGGDGNDLMASGLGVDVLSGGKGDDILLGGGGFDRMSGGLGRDQFVFDTKQSAYLTIADFAAGDLLVNQAAGSAEEAWRMFADHARQSGRHTVYDDGLVHLVLRNVRLSSIDASDFADAAALPEALFQ